MGRYLEYDIASGRIISEITSDHAPEATAGMSMLEIGDGEKIEITRYAVRNGVLVKVSETNAERQERERIRQEQAASARNRMNAVKQEYLRALIEDDATAAERLKKEYRKLKVYL